MSQLTAKDSTAGGFAATKVWGGKEAVLQSMRQRSSQASDDASVLLLFRRGRGPDFRAIQTTARASSDFSATAIQNGPAKQDHGSNVVPLSGGVEEKPIVEITASGLAFDATFGIEWQPPESEHTIGFGEGQALAGDLDAIQLAPGPHLNGGRQMPPVLRMLALVSARLADEHDALAVHWPAAGTTMSAEYFSEHVSAWLNGGAFPALGLTALANEPDGGIVSVGLSLFCGQELRIEPELAGSTPRIAHIAIRLIHELTERGGISEPETRQVDEDVAITLAPSRNGRFVRVRPV